MPRILPLLFVSLLSAGCASPPKLYKVESVYVCAAQECGQAAQNYGAEQMLAGLQRLLAANDGLEFKYCDSDPKNRTCLSQGFCHFVQGGIFPGLGCYKSGMVIAPSIDETQKRIRFQKKVSGTWNAVPWVATDHAATVTVQSVDEIVWEDEPHYTSWMVIGTSVNTFSFAVQSVDFDRGILGGYWKHGLTGMGSGTGSGYGILVFPKAMPRGDNWLTMPLEKGK